MSYTHTITVPLGWKETVERTRTALAELSATEPDA